MKYMEISPLSSRQYDELSFELDLQLFAGDKTEEPTGKKLADAREKGQVARSQELSTAFVLMAGFWALKAMGENIYIEITGYISYIFSNLTQEIASESVMNLFLGVMVVLAKTALPLMLVIMVTGLAINSFQVGFNVTTETLTFNLDKINPINGFGRIFSKRAIAELLKSLFKIIVIGFFIYIYLKAEMIQMPKLIYIDIAEGLCFIAEIIMDLAFQVIGVIFVMALCDYLYQKWQFYQDMKMTKQEVKDEYKQMEGSPEIKSKIKQKQRQMAMMRMMKEVPHADVIITNPTHFAVALKYEKGMSAPLVIAKGQNFVAQKIKMIGREAGVTVVENPPLARALYASVEVGDAIPPELYKAVAGVLAYVYRLKNKRLA